MSYYIENIKCYSNDSKWLAKLFLQFCHEYKFHFLIFECDGMNRRFRFDWLVNNPLRLSDAVLYFETKENLLNRCKYGETYCTPVFYRRFMWRYFLLAHQKYIPKKFKSFIGEKYLLRQLRFDGAKNDKRLENILKTLKK